MAHVTTPDFWATYNKLPKSVRDRADKNYRLLQANPSHYTLKFKGLAHIGVSAQAQVIERSE